MMKKAKHWINLEKGLSDKLLHRWDLMDQEKEGKLRPRLLKRRKGKVQFKTVEMICIIEKSGWKRGGVWGRRRLYYKSQGDLGNKKKTGEIKRVNGKEMGPRSEGILKKSKRKKKGTALRGKRLIFRA